MTTISIPCTLSDTKCRNVAAGIESERRTARAAFLGIMAALFVASAAMTIAWCGPMTGGMPMPGGWSMSMAWMRMPGETWFGAAASFIGMWVVMMMAMMLPSLAPPLWRYRQAVGRARNSDGLTLLAALGYFLVWAACGIFVFSFGASLAAAEMRFATLSRGVPFAVGLVVLIAGAHQFTVWKQRHLIFCQRRPVQGIKLPANAAAAWSHGIHLGLHCGLSCANLTLILLMIGVMDLRAMGIITTAISIERLAPAAGRVTRGIGVFAVGFGLFLIAQAIGMI